MSGLPSFMRDSWQRWPRLARAPLLFRDVFDMIWRSDSKRFEDAIGFNRKCEGCISVVLSWIYAEEALCAVTTVYT